MRSTRRQLSLLTPFLGAVFLLSACADDPVTTPGGEPIVYQGRLQEGGRVQRPLILEKEGTIQIELLDLEPVLVQLPPEGETLSLTMGVGIGMLNQQACQITFGASLAVGDNLTILVQDPDACLLFFDDGSLPEDAVVEYTVTVDDVKS